MKSNSQTNALDKEVVDTIYLKDFKADKIVSYKYDSVIFFFNCNEFKTAITQFASEYKNDRPNKVVARMSSYKEPKKEILKILNEIIDELNEGSNKSDTVYLIHKPLDERTLRRWDLNEIIVTQIEKNNCAITNMKNELQSFVIRKRSVWHTGLQYRAGRRYYLPEKTNYFIDMLDQLR